MTTWSAGPCQCCGADLETDSSGEEWCLGCECWYYPGDWDHEVEEYVCDMFLAQFYARLQAWSQGVRA